MKPIRPRRHSVCNFLKLLNGHLRQLVIINDCATTGDLTLDDITRGRLTEVIAINTMVQLDTRLKFRLDLLGGHRRSGRENSDQVQRRVSRGRVMSGQLLEDFEGVGTVSTTPMRDCCSTQLLVLAWVMRSSGLVSVRVVG